jgi:type IV pilus assembly protein PilB
MIKRKKIGEILLEKGLITEKDISFALSEKHEGEMLIDALVRLGLLACSDNAYEALAAQLGVPFFQHGKDFVWDRGLAGKIDGENAERYEAVPLKEERGFLWVGMQNPQDVPTIEALRVTTGCRIRPTFLTPNLYKEGLNQLYDISVIGSEINAGDEFIDDAIEEMVVEDKAATSNKEAVKSIKSSKTTAIVLDEEEADSGIAIRLLRTILKRSMNSNTSDIHMEPGRQGAVIRFRIDGQLHEITKVDNEVYLPLCTTIKVQSEMDISERRLPQDGRFCISQAGQEVDLRVSSLPTIFGEKIVIRLLRRGTGMLRLDRLGLDKITENAMLRSINQPNGIVLITGPTGSGKSTTLYSLLREIDLVHLNVITIEDPVEYQMAGITQVNVKAEIGFTFSTILRTVLRQDPDVVMLGEIRDLETGEMSIRAALTGHLVLSTLHTNSAPATIDRLLDMGVAPYLLGSSLRFIGAQRLVRRVCNKCSENYTPSDNILAFFPDIDFSGKTFTRGQGCENCNNSGYKGRMALLEYLEVKKEIPRLISKGTVSSKIKQIATEANLYDPIYRSGLDAVFNQTTTIEEVCRIMGE